MKLEIILNPENNLIVGNYNEWFEFKTWVEQTKLFQTIVVHSGTGVEIEGIDENDSIRLTLSNRKITTFEELPKELLEQFFIHSPWYDALKNNFRI